MNAFVGFLSKPKAGLTRVLIENSNFLFVIFIFDKLNKLNNASFVWQTANDVNWMLMRVENDKAEINEENVIFTFTHLVTIK